MNRQGISFIFIAILILLTLRPTFCQDGWEAIYTEDFSSATTSGWQLDGAWHLDSVDDNFVLQGESHDFAYYTNGYRWTDYSFKSRINIQQGDLHLNFRFDQQGRYFFGIYPDGGCNVQKVFNGIITFLADNAYLFTRNVWHLVEVVCTGGNIKVFVDDTLIIELTDVDPKLGGTIMYESSDNSLIWVDDIQVVGKPPPPLPVGYRWLKTGGPPGGIGYDVRIHPSDRDIMFVTDNPSGVNKSYNGGKTWVQRNSGIDAKTGGSGDGIPIFTLMIDPNNPDIVWAGTQGQKGIFKSLDYGEFWTRKDNGVIENNITFRGIAVRPGNSDIVLAAAEVGTGIMGVEFEKIKGVIYKTTDGGENWYPVWNGNNLARVLIYNPVNPQIVYCSTGIFDREAFNSNAETGDPGGVGMLKSIDGGETWSAINNGLDNMYLGFLEMHPNDPETLYAIAYNVTYNESPAAGIYKTTNSGAHWDKLLSTDHGLTVVVISKSNPEIVYAASMHAFFTSTNGGSTWQLNEEWGPPGIVPGFPIGGVVDPDDPNRIFLNNYSGGNFLSLDGGLTWTNSSNGYTGANVKDVFINPQNEAMIYVAANSGPFSSHDGGVSWIGLKYEFSPGPYCITCFPDNPSEILASDEVHGYISKSYDEGLNWKIVLPHPNPVADTNPNWYGFTSIGIAPSSPDIVYAGMRKGSSIPGPVYGMYKSVDRGETWATINNGLDEAIRSFNVLAVDPTDPDIVYAGTIVDGIYKTVNGGESWQRMSDGLGCSDVRSLAINPQNPDIVFAGSGEGTGVFRSLNGGILWEQTNDGIKLQCPSYLRPIGGTVAGFSKDEPIPIIGQYSQYIPWTRVTDIVIDPLDPQRIYAADINTGIYLSPDGGANWYQINEGLFYKGVTSLSISPLGDVLYAGTDGNGVYRMSLGDNKAPGILYSVPNNTDTISIAANDSLDFYVDVFDLDGDTLSYVWSVDLNEVTGNDTNCYRFMADEYDIGYHVLSTEISDKDTMITIDWIINVLVPTEVNSELTVDRNSLSISQIYPNPFNTQTTINYTIPMRGKVSLTIYTIMGQIVKTLVEEDLNPGEYEVNWDCKNEQNERSPNGIYICRIEFISGEMHYIQEKKLVLVQ